MKRDPSAPESALSRRHAISALVASTAAGSTAAAARTAELSGPLTTGADYVGPGGRRRTIASKLSERVSVLDFDVDPNGRNDSSGGFRKALEQLAGGLLFIPNGTFLVSRLGSLGPAGQQIVGESRWKTVLRTERGAGPIFSNPVATKGTSAFHLISDLQIDLNGQAVVAFDLASVNASTIQRVHVNGGFGRVGPGTGVRFAAPLQKGAYDNALYDCTFEYLDRALVWETGANANSLFNCRINNCRIGLHAAPSGEVDTVRVFGGRIEACDVGLIEGGHYSGYHSVRFENNRTADIAFTARSIGAGFWGGFTATSSLVVKDITLATSPHIDSSDFGHFAVEESPSRPRVSSGRHVFGAAGKAPSVHAKSDYAAYFHDYGLFRNGVAVEFSNAQGNDSIVGMSASADNRLIISGYDRAAGAFATVELGGGPAVQPIVSGKTDLGSKDRPYKALHLSQGIHIGGRRVLAIRQPSIADDRSGAPNSDTLNKILGALRTHGLIDV